MSTRRKSRVRPVPTKAALRARERWIYRGDERPDFAVEPGPGQESVWDYPRPPRIVADPRELVVRSGSLLLARSQRAVRVLETTAPPTFYVSPKDVELDRLERTDASSFCEWKGEAEYWALRGADEPVAWSYPDPFEEYAALEGWLCFYPARIECEVGGIRVRPQGGAVYGGWVTPEIVGPFKGEPGSENW